MKLLDKINNSILRLSIASFALIASSPLAFAEGDGKGIVEVNERLVTAADSFGAVLSICAFIVGAAALFRAVTTIMNHSENPRENPMKNVVFYGIAAGIGLGYSYFTITAMETVTGKSSNENISTDIFKATK